METRKDNITEKHRENPDTPHPPTAHNPYPYPLQKTNRKGWIRALIALIIVAVVVTLFCVVVGIFEHHEKGLQEATPVETVVIDR